MKLILREDVDEPRQGRRPRRGEERLRAQLPPPAGPGGAGQPEERAELEHQKAVASAKAAKLKASPQAVAKRLAETPVTLKRKVGEQDKLYGSVTALDIAEALAARGLELDRRAIDLGEPIKTLGDFEVPVKLHSEVVGKAKVKVEAEPLAG